MDTTTASCCHPKCSQNCGVWLALGKILLAHIGTYRPHDVQFWPHFPPPLQLHIMSAWLNPRVKHFSPSTLCTVSVIITLNTFLVSGKSDFFCTFISYKQHIGSLCTTLFVKQCTFVINISVKFLFAKKFLIIFCISRLGKIIEKKL